jgi:hypothetical protein
MFLLKVSDSNFFGANLNELINLLKKKTDKPYVVKID